MEPIFLEPAFKDYIWGGTRIKYSLNKHTPYEKTAESWEVSTNPDGKSTIRNGMYKGETLADVFDFQEVRKDIFGTKTTNMETFPLLVKFIDAETNLSVQVHPDDKYARRVENSNGKTEMWYIMDAGENAKIIDGVKENVTTKQLEEAIYSNSLESLLNYVDVKQGDVIYIPSGTIHAILGNTLICEIQQNSNLTYRVYDWGRVGKDGKPRELHIQKAIDVVDCSLRPQIKNTDTLEGESNIISSEYFKTDKIKIKGSEKSSSSVETFYIMNVVKGFGKLITSTNEYDIKYGDSFIIPATLGEFELQGDMEILKSYI